MNLGKPHGLLGQTPTSLWHKLVKTKLLSNYLKIKNSLCCETYQYESLNQTCRTFSSMTAIGAMAISKPLQGSGSCPGCRLALRNPYFFRSHVYWMWNGCTLMSLVPLAAKKSHTNFQPWKSSPNPWSGDIWGFKSAVFKENHLQNPSKSNKSHDFRVRARHFQMTIVRNHSLVPLYRLV